MKTSLLFVAVLTVLTLSGAVSAIAAPCDGSAAAPKKSGTPLRLRPEQSPRAGASSFHALPEAHIVSAFLLRSGTTTFYTDTRGRVIGRSGRGYGSGVSWYDQSRSDAARPTRIAVKRDIMARGR